MLTNSKIKHIKSLQKKKFRQEHNEFVVEGYKIIKELIEGGWSFKELFLTEEGLNQLKLDFPETDFEYIQTTQNQIERASLLKSNNFGLGILSIPNREEPKYKNNITLLLDDVKDPGNLGTIIRTCNWFKIDQIICSKETVDVYNPKVIQSTMGAFSRIPIYYKDLFDELNVIKEQNVKTYCTVLSGEAISAINQISEGVIIMGGESNGVKEEIIKISDQLVTIPNYSDNSMESLNVAIATSIICYELRRN